MKTKINLKNIQLYGWHGILEEELEKGQKFELDINIEFNQDPKLIVDNIDNTVDYSKLYKIVKKIFISKRYNLIESLAYDIAKSIYKNFLIDSCIIAIRKPNVPINGKLDFVEVEVSYNG